MPTYEYRCEDCRRKFELFLSYSEYGSKEILCPHCDSNNTRRKISRVKIAHSNESRFENLADPNALAGLEDDPRSLGRMMRQMSGEIGEDMGPEFDEVVNRLESGQNPEDIEKELPELGEGGMGGGLDGAGFSDGLDDL